MRGTVERFAPSLFLRDTALTQADAAMREFTRRIRAEQGGAILAELHGLLDRLFEQMGHDADDMPDTLNAADAFARKYGSARDLSQVFIGAAHSLGIPARYVAGYYRGSDGSAAQHAGHAWAEAFVPDLGWVAFDPANGLCPTDAHVRVAIGLDALGAAPVRGTRYGPGAEMLEVAIKVGQ